MRGRFAPSPTGAVHLGNARTALLAWLDARRQGGALIMRIEDLDRERLVPGAEARLLDDLGWLGLDWDEGPDVGGPFAPYRQSERAARYDDAVAALLRSGHAFPCACSRADVARAASAPHDLGELGEPGELGQEGPRYPGTCRDRPPEEIAARARAHGRRPTVRFDSRRATPPGGDHQPEVDDFVLRRADGVAAYQLAVVVDDIAMEITRVVRGDDLLSSTPRQQALYRALGAPPPSFTHVALVLAPGGERLAKRTRPPSIGDLRRQGVAAAVIVGALAASAELCPPGARLHPRELVVTFDLARIRRTAVTIDLAGLVGPGVI